MKTPQRIQLSRRRGWRMPPDTVKVDRSTPWGNPFVLGVDGDRAACIAKYEALVTGGPVEDERLNAVRTFVHANIRTLQGRNLACWCPLDGPCHADVLLTLANRGRAPPGGK